MDTGRGVAKSLSEVSVPLLVFCGRCSMYVCLCSALTENDIKLRLRAGESLAEIKRRTGAGDNCGNCDNHIRKMARQYSVVHKERRKAG